MKATMKQLLRQDFAQYVRPHFEKSECECCGSDTERLHVHHIIHFQELLDETLKQLNLQQYDDADMYTDEQLQLIRDIMLGKQMRIKYVTCCEPCHRELHDGSYHPDKKPKPKKENRKRESKQKEKQVKVKEQEQIKVKEEQQQQLQLHNKIIERLEVGMVLKNYKELCEVLEVEVKHGNGKISQLKDFKQYFDWTKQGQKITITEIYNTVQEREPGRGQHPNSLEAFKKHNEEVGYTIEITTTNLVVGMEFYSYKKLCEFLGIEPKLNSRSRIIQQEKLKQFFNWEWKPKERKIVITEIYE